MQEQAELSLLQEVTHTCRHASAIWPLLLQVWLESLGSLFTQASGVSLSGILIHRNKVDLEISVLISTPTLRQRSYYKAQEPFVGPGSSGLGEYEREA